MSTPKMLSEDFDKKIKEAAEHHSPSYDEKSWEKMEALLNKFLPEKKDRRSYILFLLLILVAGGGGFILFTNPFSKSNNQFAGAGNKTIPVATEKNNTTPAVKTGMENANEIKKQVETPVTGNTFPESDISTLKNVSEIPTKQIFNKPLQTGDSKTYTPAEQTKPVKTIPVNQKDDQKTNITDNTQPVTTQKDEPVKDKKDSNKVTSSDTENKTNQTNQEILTEKKPENKNATKQKTGFLSRLAVTLSAGPDVSFIGLDNIGKIKPVYGAGLSYRFSNRLAIRSGFYVTKKVYSTGPENYKPPSNFWSYYPNLKQIDADCDVYEVPLNIDYNFSVGQKQSWFASAGLSSVFMKKEKYNYLFKPAYSSQYVYYSHTHNNENKHYFSILNLSGGYTRKISHAVSFTAEPYLQLPLTGIG
ncbi:MAG: hypothetical protein EPN92_09125, partial [Chitinophagaceae bacterium]